MKKHYSKSLLFTSLMLLFVTFTYGQFEVTNANDSGAGSFRQAIIDANSTPGANSITFSDDFTINLTSGVIEITEDVTITGNGIEQTILDGTANGVSRILLFSAGTMHSISGVTFQNTLSDLNGGAIAAISAGTLTITSSAFNSNLSIGSLGGGAIYSESTNLIVEDSDFDSNFALNPNGGSGGAILQAVTGTLTISAGTFTNNVSARAGGAIEVNSPDLITITDGLYDANSTGTSPGNGGALHITGPANSNITAAIFTNNIASREGGALWNGSGTMTVTDSTIDNNDAQGDAADDGGGGVFNNGGNLIITGTTTITNNTASGAAGSGGGIFSLTPGTISIDGITIANNSANRAGGGIEINSAAGEVYTFNDVTLDGNTISNPSPGNGGGYHISGPADTNFNGGSILNNSASEGGGLWNGTGIMTISGTLFTNNIANGPNTGGGAIFNNGGTLNIDATTILTANTAIGDTPGGRGGAIFNNTSGVLLIEIGTVISSNYASRAGGAIEDSSGNTLILNQVTMTGNSAGIDIGLGTMANPGNGGALHLSGTTNATITGGNISGNLAALEGGGLWNSTGNMLVDGTLIDGNTASGAAANEGGGGVFNNGGMLTIVNATISNNIANGAAGSGGGVLNDNGILSITDSEISNNSSVRAGGGVEDNSVAGNTLILNNVDMVNNSTDAAPGNGGGLHITGPGDSLITGGNYTNNFAASEGGGLWNGSGEMTIENVIITANTASGADADNGGGGIFNNGGSLNILNATVSENIANGASGSGGGLLSTDGNVAIASTSFTSNAANRAGGAIEIIDGNLAFADSEMIDNDVNGIAGTAAPGNGGGLHITGMNGVIEIMNAVITGNQAAREGGGLWNQSGTTMNVSLSTIDGNSAFGTASDDGGAGIFNNGGILNIETSTISNNSSFGIGGTGGGILNANNGDLNILTSTISNNTSAGGGGGIANLGANTVVNASTIVMNNADLSGGGILSISNTEIKNTIIALNATNTDGTDVAGVFTSADYNLIGLDDLSAFPEATNDIEGVDPMISPLQDNGGTTLTHMLLEGSMAIDAGNPADTFTDQAGQDIVGIRDIGALESPFILNVDDIVNLSEAILLYPNPAKTEVVLEIPEIFGSLINMSIIEMGSGKTVQKITPAFGENTLNISNLSSGIYLLKITSDTNFALKKLIVSK